MYRLVVSPQLKIILMCIRHFVIPASVCATSTRTTSNRLEIISNRSQCSKERARFLLPPSYDRIDAGITETRQATPRERRSYADDLNLIPHFSHRSPRRQSSGEPSLGKIAARRIVQDDVGRRVTGLTKSLVAQERATRVEKERLRKRSRR